MTQASNGTSYESFLPNETALVIGGGVAGMQAALDLANQEFKVILVEKSPSIGGIMAMLDKTFPTLDCSACILTPRLSEVARHPNIELLTYSEVEGLSGEAGDFRATIRKKARKVKSNCSGCGECVPQCPIEVPNEFDRTLGVRKAIYIGFPQNTPLIYTVDSRNCIKCEMCVKHCDREAIDLNMEDEIIEVPVGAVVVATGYDLVDVSPFYRFGYGKFKNVITALEYERLINASGPTGGRLQRLSDGKVPRSIGFIQCVGARDLRRGVPNCSRICCMYAIKNAVMAKELQHDVVKNVTLYYVDIRAFGKGFEEFTEMAKTRFGVRFLRGRVGEVNEIARSGNLLLSVEDTEIGAVRQDEHELVVLCPGVKPAQDTRSLGDMLGINLDTEGFVKVVDSLTTPVDTTVPGIFVCGCAEGAKDIPDSVASGSAAAMRASIVLTNGGEHR